MAHTTTHRFRTGAAAAFCALALASTAVGPAGARPAAPRVVPSTADALISYSVYEDFPPVAHRAGVSTPIPSGGTSPVHIVAGHFRSGAGGDAILYRTATGADSIVHLASAGDGVSVSEEPLTIGGAFRPVVGDFDGNGIDDVIWYAPGTERDYLWLFDASGAHTSRAISIGGSYRPYALDANGDGRSDVLWYGPGSLPDRMWLMGPGAVPATTSLSIGGDYRIVVGPFGKAAAGQPADRVVFYNPSGADWLWTFKTTGDHSSYKLPAIDGDYTPLGGQFIEEAYGTLFFYGAGTLPERLWAFGPPPADVAEQESPPQVSKAYVPVTGDFDGNGLTDIAWVGDKIGNRLWQFQLDGTVAGSPLALPYRASFATAAVPVD